MSAYYKLFSQIINTYLIIILTYTVYLFVLDGFFYRYSGAL